MIALALHIWCVKCPYKMKGTSKLRFLFLKERKTLGDESNQALCFSPQKKRWDLLLLIISLLHHYVTACKISPSFHWVKSLYAHYIEFCHNKLICFSASALLGLNSVSKQLVFAWFAASQGVKRRWLCGCQDSYWNIQSLIQNQRRIILVILLILIHHSQINMVAWGREGECRL